MYRIGEFSKFAMVSTRTLRLYDEMGLLKPEQQDLATSYRYYSAGQLARLNRILVLKDMGLSLEQIRPLLDSNISPEQIRGMLKLKQAELRQQIKEGYDRLARIETWFQQLDANSLSLEYQVGLKKVEPQPVIAIKTVIPGLEDLPPLFEELAAHLARHRVMPAGPPQALFFDEEYRESDLNIEVTLPVRGAVPETGRIQLRGLPALETAASVVHTGPHEKLVKAFGAALNWIEANNYRINGPNREIFVKFAPLSDQANFVTEVIVPVAKI
jgi:DNA-binding transcriptional MerR regulator/effector-binding domain-containing protein